MPKHCESEFQKCVASKIPVTKCAIARSTCLRPDPVRPPDRMGEPCSCEPPNKCLNAGIAYGYTPDGKPAGSVRVEAGCKTPAQITQINAELAAIGRGPADKPAGFLAATCNNSCCPPGGRIVIRNGQAVLQSAQRICRI